MLKIEGEEFFFIYKIMIPHLFNLYWFVFCFNLFGWRFYIYRASLIILTDYAASPASSASIF